MKRFILLLILICFIEVLNAEAKNISDEEFVNLYTEEGLEEYITILPVNGSVFEAYISKEVYLEHKYFLYHPSEGYSDKRLNTESMDSRLQYEFLGFNELGEKIRNSKYKNSGPISPGFPVNRKFDNLFRAPESWNNDNIAPYINKMLSVPMRYGAEPWLGEIMMQGSEQITPLWRGWGNYQNTLELQIPLTPHTDSNIYVESNNGVNYANFYQLKNAPQVNWKPSIKATIKIFNEEGKETNQLEPKPGEEKVTFSIKVTTEAIDDEINELYINEITSSITHIANLAITDQGA